MNLCIWHYKWKWWEREKKLAASEWVIKWWERENERTKMIKNTNHKYTQFTKQQTSAVAAATATSPIIITNKNESTDRVLAKISNEHLKHTAFYVFFLFFVLFSLFKTTTTTKEEEEEDGSVHRLAFCICTAHITHAQKWQDDFWGEFWCFFFFLFSNLISPFLSFRVVSFYSVRDFVYSFTLDSQFQFFWRRCRRRRRSLTYSKLIYKQMNQTNNNNGRMFRYFDKAICVVIFMCVLKETNTWLCVCVCIYPIGIVCDGEAIATALASSSTCFVYYFCQFDR